ncbi:hypothetical protein BDZ85DRAFT_285993 [Elsinoe ampelina]|uniref:Uncharacterized protein n=1 Tax=Elsinoe ampelina TaxID=302913 RepID=A0A6A6FZ48_9PEZI|nr:hypothetical protein BDZ85DRAFT_285993 [Elsinoe ampelina]
MTIARAAIIDAATGGGNTLKRKKAIDAIVRITQAAGFQDYTSAIIKNYRHTATSDQRPHATIWLKNPQMERMGTHHPLHIYLDRNDGYEAHRLFLEKKDENPRRGKKKDKGKGKGKRREDKGGFRCILM